MKRTAGAAVLGSFLLVGCGVTVDQINPGVSQFNGDSVSIQLDGTAMDFATAEVRKAADARADSMAGEICRRGHRKRAEFTSRRRFSTGQYSYVVERLYLCLG